MADYLDGLIGRGNKTNEVLKMFKDIKSYSVTFQDHHIDLQPHQRNYAAERISSLTRELKDESNDCLIPSHEHINKKIASFTTMLLHSYYNHRRRRQSICGFILDANINI